MNSPSLTGGKATLNPVSLWPPRRPPRMPTALFFTTFAFLSLRRRVYLCLSASISYLSVKERRTGTVDIRMYIIRDYLSLSEKGLRHVTKWEHLQRNR